MTKVNAKLLTGITFNRKQYPTGAVVSLPDSVFRELVARNVVTEAEEVIHADALPERNMTVAELKAELDSLGISYKAKATHAELTKLLEKAGA